MDESAAQAIHENAFVVLDTNVLLDLYGYSHDTSAEFLEILDSIAERLWMPHHVGSEFLGLRAAIRAATAENHDIRLKALSDLQKALKNTGGSESHVGGDEDEANFQKALTSYTARLKKHKNAISDWATGTRDDLLEKILDLYEGKTGQAPSAAWYSDRQRVGKDRYEQGIPPGFMDALKPSNRFGDFYIWCQCIERAKTVRLPLIFVTRDRKEDWWQKEGNEELGPRTELLQEFWDETGQRLILMNPTSFYDAFRRPPALDKQTDSTVRDEIVATQASEQKRAHWPIPIPVVPEAHRMLEAWLANWQPPNLQEFQSAAILRAAQAAAEFSLHDRDALADDDDEIDPPEDENPDGAADNDTDG